MLITDRAFIGLGSVGLNQKTIRNATFATIAMYQSTEATLRNRLDVRNRWRRPPILWLRFAGWFASGFGFGWLIRAAINIATTGLIMIAIIVADCAIIISFSYLVISPFLNQWIHRKCNTKRLDKQDKV